jgi:hypothetical protein
LRALAAEGEEGVELFVGLDAFIGNGVAPRRRRALRGSYRTLALELRDAEMRDVLAAPINAMPTLAVTTVDSRPSRGLEITSSSRKASSAACGWSTIPSAITTNSSPPKRPASSRVLTAADIRSATSRITSSARLQRSVEPREDRRPVQ